MKMDSRLMKWLIIAAAAIVALFFVFKIVSIISGEYETVSAENNTVYQTLDVDAYVVRDETLLFNSSGGTVVSTADNAEKVKGDSAVAASFSSAAEAESYVKLEYLRRLLEGYGEIDSQLALANIDVDMLGEQVNSDFDKIIEAVYSGDYSSLSELKLDYLVDISRRQIAVGTPIDCTEKIAGLQAQISQIESGAVPRSTVLAGTGGYYVNYTDGYENVLTPDLLDSVSAKDIESALKAEPAQAQENCVGKIVGGFCWYMLAQVDSDKIGQLSVGSKQKVIIGNSSSNTIEARLYAVRRDASGDKTVIILKCNSVTEDLLALRCVKAKIVLDEHTGLKIPKKAVRIVDSNECVYVKVGRVTKLRYLNIIYACDEFVLAAAPEPGSEVELAGTHLKVHDEIILNGKGLGDD